MTKTQDIGANMFKEKSQNVKKIGLLFRSSEKKSSSCHLCNLANFPTLSRLLSS